MTPTNFSNYAPLTKKPNVAGFKLPLIPPNARSCCHSGTSCQQYDRKAKPANVLVASKMLFEGTLQLVEVPLRRDAFLVRKVRETTTMNEIERAKSKNLFDKRCYSGPTHAQSHATFPPFHSNLFKGRKIYVVTTPPTEVLYLP